MAKFLLRVWHEQTLYDCADYEVEAATIEEAAAQLYAIHRKTEAHGLEERLPDNVRDIEHGTRAFKPLDPQEIVDGDSGVAEINAEGRRIRDIEFYEFPYSEGA